MPEIVIVDEIGTEAEALACRTIAERGVQLIGTAHGQMLENLIKNPTLSDLIGGICSVTLGALFARANFAAEGHGTLGLSSTFHGHFSRSALTKCCR